MGTDEAVGFWFHLGYTAILLFQWAYDGDLYEQESEAVLGGPLAGLRHWRSSFNDVPQLSWNSMKPASTYATRSARWSADVTSAS